VGEHKMKVKKKQELTKRYYIEIGQMRCERNRQESKKKDQRGQRRRESEEEIHKDESGPEGDPKRNPGSFKSCVNGPNQLKLIRVCGQGQQERKGGREKT
jgi:hypothetical protein